MAVSKAAPKKKEKKVKKAARKKSQDKAARKADPSATEDAAAAQARNPKAFVFSGRGKAKLQQARSAERDQKRMHVPVVDTTPEEPPPFVVVVHGPPGVGKTTLIKNLIKHYVNQNLSEVKGPISVVSGKTRRLTFVECPQDLHGMIDAAKYADLVLLMVDGGFGFEMETFEFLNLLQVHGFPKVMGVLTHLDAFKDQKKLKKTKKALKHRFWAEIYQGAKLFYLSGMKNGKYMKREVLNLARFISVMKFRPLNWRMAHPYLLTDRLEDITPVEDIRQNPKCDREIAVYGYLRGTKLKGNARVHIAGVGDATVEEVDALTDPCPLPSTLKKRGLNERERVLYAPMADVGGLLYDKDAVYIDIPDWKMQYSKGDGGVAPKYDEGEDMVRQLQANQTGVDDKLQQAQIQLFKNQQLLLSGDHDSPTADGEEEEEGSSDAEDSGSEESDSDAESGSDEGEDEEEDAGLSFAGMPQEQQEAGQHRQRRRAVFSTPALTGGNADSSDQEDEEEEDHEEEEDEEEAGQDPNELAARQQSGSSAESSGQDDSEAESLDSEGLGRAATWKSGIRRNAAALFTRRSADMQSYVYGAPATDPTRGKGVAPQSTPSAHPSIGDDVDDDEDDDLFAPKRRDSGSGADGSSLDAPDSSRVALDDSLLTKWGEPGQTERLRNRFVTGDWDAAGKRDAARPAAEDEEDRDEAFGDFEDLETGEKFGADGDAATATALQAIQDAAAEETKQRLAEKAAKKAAFNAEYDVGGSKAVKDGKGHKKKKAADADEEEEETYYDAMKKDMGDRAARTKAAMDELDEEQRIAMEGFRPGTYLRLRFTGVPCELMQHFDPSQPLLVGGVSPAEEGVGFMQLRFKRHRWFPKILKTRDPLVFSIGWRRFQSMPVYATEDANGRHRMLKYTPEHMHCLATIYGAMAPPNTGVLAIQTSTSNQQSWRISATGVVLNLDASVRVMKKLKLKGTPFKVHKHTAFLGGMFNSQLEVSKFEGASIRTVSGIRGIIKKALRPGVQKSQDGSFRATFEDKPLMSDIVFLRAWIGVDLPRFYNPVTNLLAPAVRSAPRQLKPGHMAAEDPDALALGATDANAIALPGPPAARPPALGFAPAAAFRGARPGMVFKTGAQGTGYYPDGSSLASPSQLPAPAGTSGAESVGAAQGDGWKGMRTVAQLRRELGVGAPRDTNSLYKAIERGPRKFNPLKVPRALQAQLPFKSKVMNFPGRKRDTLEQRRAIKVREPGEKRADALVHALNTIRNAKNQKRREQQTRRREERKKKLALEDAWKIQYNKEERKKRYRDQGKAEALAEKRQRRD